MKSLKFYIEQFGIEEKSNKTEIFKKKLINNYDINLELYYYKKDYIILSKIIVPKENRKEGIGTQVMKEIIDFCNTNNYKIGLTPSNSFGGSKTRLNKFYRRFGFKKNKDYEFNELLVYTPRGYNEH